MFGKLSVYSDHVCSSDSQTGVFFGKSYPSDPERNSRCGSVFYIDRPVDNIVTDVETAHRPLLKDGPEKLYQLFDERHQLYLDSCHYHVKNDGTLTDIVNKIVEDID